MRSRLRLFAPVVGFLLFAYGCAGETTQETATTETMPADPAPINDLRSRFETAYNAGDAAALAALHTEDAVLLPDHAAAVDGRAQIQQFYEQLFTRFTPNLSIMPADTEITGDVAHEHGTYSLTLTPKAEGEAMMESGNYLVVLERQADGTWLLHHDINNTSSPHPGMEGAAPPQP